MEFYVVIPGGSKSSEYIGPFSTRAKAEEEAKKTDGARVVESPEKRR